MRSSPPYVAFPTSSSIFSSNCPFFSIGVVLKRAQYFITCKGFSRGVTAGPEATVRALLDPAAFGVGTEQLSLFAAPAVQELAAQGMRPASAAREVCEEAVSCLARQM